MECLDNTPKLLNCMYYGSYDRPCNIHDVYTKIMIILLPGRSPYRSRFHVSPFHVSNRSLVPCLNDSTVSPEYFLLTDRSVKCLLVSLRPFHRTVCGPREDCRVSFNPRTQTPERPSKSSTVIGTKLVNVG